MSEKRLALQWVNDMPIIDGARLFDTMAEASAFIDAQPDSECWTVPRIDYCNPTEDALREQLRQKEGELERVVERAYKAGQYAQYSVGWNDSDVKKDLTVQETEGGG